VESYEQPPFSPIRSGPKAASKPFRQKQFPSSSKGNRVYQSGSLLKDHAENSAWAILEAAQEPGYFAAGQPKPSVFQAQISANPFRFLTKIFNAQDDYTTRLFAPHPTRGLRAAVL